MKSNVARTNVALRSIGSTCCALACLLALAAPSAAAVLVLDNFTSSEISSGTALNGRTPQDVNVPGNTWTTYGAFLSGGNTITTDAGRNIGLQAADEQEQTGLNGLNQNTLLRVSGTFQYDGGGYPGELYRASGVGFFATGTPSNGNGFYTGLAIGPTSDTDSSLALKLESNNMGSQGGSVTQLAYTGSLLSPSDYHTLTYTVNTVTGNLVSVVLDGQSYSFPTTTLFSAANTANFGFYTAGPFGGELGKFDFVSVASVPEPSSWLLLGLGSMLLAARTYSRRGSRARQA